MDHHGAAQERPQLSGGWAWDAATKEEYANYLGRGKPPELQISSPGTTESKGARGPEEWMTAGTRATGASTPRTGRRVKARWGPHHDPPIEAEIVMDMLGTCENPPDDGGGGSGKP